MLTNGDAERGKQQLESEVSYTLEYYLFYLFSFFLDFAICRPPYLASSTRQPWTRLPTSQSDN
jgi:hypothetical protein